MPRYTFINPTQSAVHLPFKGGVRLGPNSHRVLDLFAADVDNEDVQRLIRAGVLRVSVDDDPNKDNNVEIFPGPHPSGGDLILPPSATDPVGGMEGQQYYNTTINEYLYYDASRGKWLSQDVPPLQVGRNGGTAAGSYYRGVNGLVLGPTIGFRMSNNGTVVALEYTRTDTDAATFNVTANGAVIATAPSSALSGGVVLNADFNAGDILAVQNAAGGNTTSNVQAWFRVKWRA